jgi:hypothetical protein
VRLTLQNEGTTRAMGLACVVASGTPGVQVADGAATLDLFACLGRSLCREVTFQVRVAPTAAPGTVARLGCELVDAQERTWPVEIPLRVEAAQAAPRFDGLTVQDDPDRDGVLSPGETARLRVRLQNVGPSALPTSTCTVSSATAWLTLSQATPTLNFPFCAADAECGHSDVRVVVSPEAPPGAEGQLECPLTDDRGLTFPVTIPVRLGP